MGNQLSHWLHTAHAKAYTSLSQPAAREIARWSGIPMEPQESAMCLGCHATAAEAEPWEKDETFFLYEGVQCEKCHGPESLHNIQADSPNANNLGSVVVGGEDAGYGHVGRDAGPGPPPVLRPGR